MRILVASSYPPDHCGVGRYALQQVEALSAQGHHVEVMSLAGLGCVEHHLDFARPQDLAAALAIFAHFDEVLVHYAPAIIAVGDRKTQRLRWAGFFATVYAAAKMFPSKIKVIVHESFVFKGRPLEALQKQFWRGLSEIRFHTSAERDRFLADNPGVSPIVCKLVDHAGHMTPNYRGSRSEARLALGVPNDQVVFVSCGFIQEHKGFDRVVDIFREGLVPANAHYYVVGSVRVEKPELRAYAEALKSSALQSQQVTVREEFVDDTAFDQWLVAADCVVVPYRKIWSSSIVARAKLLDRPVIATRVGGLAEQLSSTDSVVDDDAGLRQAILARARAPRERTSKSKRAIAAARPLRLAFCISRFGSDVRGGAETALKNEALALQARGHDVEVWTTTTDSMDRFNSAFTAGQAQDAGLTVHRFPSNSYLWPLFLPLHKRMHRPSPPRPLQWAWSKTSIDSPELHEHIREHAHERDALIFSQSLFGVTQNGVRLAPERSLIQPCLHDEAPAALDPIQAAWRSARGILYYSAAEQQIAAAKGLFNPREAVVGCGLEPMPLGDGARFRAKHGIEGEYLLFVGKLSMLKNIPWLLRQFQTWQTHGGRGLTLILAGTGEYEPPVTQNVRVLRNISDEDKRDGMAGALALIQPSLFESFSLVMMEAWQQKRPVIVHSDCAATMEHVGTCGGGFGISSASTLGSAIDALRADASSAAAMGAAGADYVANKFSWNAVCARYVAAIELFVTSHRQT